MTVDKDIVRWPDGCLAVWLTDCLVGWFTDCLPAWRPGDQTERAVIVLQWQEQAHKVQEW